MESLWKSGQKGLSELRGTLYSDAACTLRIGGTYTVHLAAPLLLGPI
jgi:hypothetical protein